MADTMTPEQRSRCMRAVGQKDTTPELIVRSLVHRMGYRFRLHRRDLPGSPDLVFPSKRKVIFVHGCFWHRHPRCKYATTPKVRQEYWVAKFERNRERDATAVRLLRKGGWEVLVIWECEAREMELAMTKVQKFMNIPDEY